MDFAVKTLLRACERGDLEKVGKWLVSSKKVDVADEDGHTPLQVAAANDQVSLVTMLLAAGSSDVASNANGWTPLHHACFHGHTDVCRVILDRSKTTLNAKNRFGATPLTVAVAGGHTDAVRLLLQYGASADADDGAVLNAGAIAALHGRESALRRLLDYHPKVVNMPMTDTFWTPLMMAASSGCKPIALLLVDHGADPDRLNLLNKTALDISASSNNLEVKSYLTRITSITSNMMHRDATEDFFDAARQGHLDKVASLVANGVVNIDVEDGNGGTALMIASVSGHVGIVNLLITQGADLNKVDKVNGWTALMQATFYGHSDIARLLLDGGADPAIVAHNGFNAFDLAALLEETDTDLLRHLAAKTIETVPPLLTLDNEAQLGHRVRPPLSRSLSISALSKLSDDSIRKHQAPVQDSRGFKAWWGKMSARFRKAKPEHAVPHHGRTSDGPERRRGELRGSVFTLGFSGAATGMSSYVLGSAVCPPSHDEADCIAAKFCMPDGLEGSVHGLTSGRKLFVKRRRSNHDMKAGNVRDILLRHGLQRYVDIFQHQEIDVTALQELTEDDMAALGITSDIDRRAILDLIQSLQNSRHCHVP